MLKILRRVVICFHRKSQEPTQGQPGSLQGDTRLNTVQGFVTSLCGDCGLINESIHFSTDVTGNVPLRVGQKVAAVVEEDEISRRLKAINVDAISDNFIGSGLSPPRIRVLIACVTSVKKNGFCVNKKTYCSLDIVSEGFVPYKGDWLEVEYSIQPGSSKIRAHSAKPVNYKHVDEVCITSLNGRNGVIEHTIFFNLDSLTLPDGYVPHIYDVINVIMIESTQPCYNWRAVSIIPVQMV